MIFRRRKLQQWIQRLIRHIQEVIQLQAGNEYREGQEDKSKRNFAGRSLKG
jgi:hypothetical protein